MLREAGVENEGRWTWQQIKTFLLWETTEPVCRARGAERALRGSGQGERPEAAIGVNYETSKKE